MYTSLFVSQSSQTFTFECLTHIKNVRLQCFCLFFIYVLRVPPIVRILGILLFLEQKTHAFNSHNSIFISCIAPCLSLLTFPSNYLHFYYVFHFTILSLYSLLILKQPSNLSPPTILIHLTDWTDAKFINISLKFFKIR